MSAEKTKNQGPEQTSTADFNAARASIQRTPLEKLFAPNRINESKLRLKCSVSDDICNVNCIATGIGSSFRVSTCPALLKIVQSKHAETVKWQREEHEKSLAAARKPKINNESNVSNES